MEHQAKRKIIAHIFCSVLLYTHFIVHTSLDCSPFSFRKITVEVWTPQKKTKKQANNQKFFIQYVTINSEKEANLHI